MNGSIKMIDSLVDQLNNAKLDGKTGKPLTGHAEDHTDVRQRSS